MMINHRKFQKFEMELAKGEKVNLKRNFQIIEALYDEAVALGAIPLRDPLEGIKIDIKIAKIVNGISKTP